MTIHVTKINESFSYLDGTNEELNQIHEFLKVFVPSSKFDKMVKIGLRQPYKFFSSKQHGKLLVYNGHLPLIFNQTNKFDISNEVSDKVDNFIKTLPLPFTPYDYQIKAVKKAITMEKGLLRSCTGCLDENSIIDVEIPGYTEEDIRKILEN